MYVRSQTKDKVAVVMSLHEARRLLAGLREHRDAMGPQGAEIEQALAALGITPLGNPPHITYSHAPLRD
ncbi:MAG: hypothetical protein KGJ12_07975 [Gammaproteobacteria bacterium]|nr:hypothetical protein [Gammaproteobacteria bacterium]